MKTYAEISEHLKTGLSKMEIYEKLNTNEGKGKEVAQAISTFPSSRNYQAKQARIQTFFTYFLVYSVLLFSYLMIDLVYKKEWLVLAVFAALTAGAFYIYSFAKKGVMNAMVAMMVFPLIKTLQLGYQHIVFLTSPTQEILSPTQSLLLHISSIFFMYSLFSVIYGVKLFRDIFEGEKVVGRMKWDSENQKPNFPDESEVSA